MPRSKVHETPDFLLGISRYQDFKISDLPAIARASNPPATFPVSVCNRMQCVVLRFIKVIGREYDRNGKAIERDVARFDLDQINNELSCAIHCFDGAQSSKIVSHILGVGWLPETAPDELIVYAGMAPFHGDLLSPREFCRIWNIPQPTVAAMNLPGFLDNQGIEPVAQAVDSPMQQS